MKSRLKNSLPPPFKYSTEYLPARSGTVQPIFALLACLLSAVLLSAQEDVAETKANVHIDTTPIVEPAITASEREHWAFRAIRRLPQPTVKDSTWLRSPIDAFILAPIEAKLWRPAAEAQRGTLLRRLSFDLGGLPPAPEEIAAFEADKSPDAYERQVDRLLSAPAYGERYAQYWLDLARFAESDGYEFDTVRPHAWKYRDWVIAALNADMPYDAFVRQQLAGDEIRGAKFTLALSDKLLAEPAANAPKSKKPTAPPPALAQIPTTFCLAGPDMPDVNDQVERRHNVMNELASTVGSALLGLQVGCAQCHNHKYDPISQADFYRLRAVFESAVPAYKRDVPVNALAHQESPVVSRLWIRGDHRRPGAELQPAFPRIASTSPTRSVSEGNAASRLELADWLVSAKNPLTSRVIANRIWQWHFGRGLLQTPSDFGVMGGPLTHPELLDWLASELRDSGWGMKRLQRAILCSATYRQAGINAEFRMQNAESPPADPENELFTRFPRQRLNGEAIRDALLAAAGLLTSESGGPGVMPPLPDELLGTLLKGQWSASQREADHYKRSIYVFARRNLRYPLFEAFDRPDGNGSCPLRNRSTTAPQSLLLLNSELSLLAAQHLAGRVLSDSGETGNGDAGNKIERLYLIALSRRPTAVEQTNLENFLTADRQRLTAEGRPKTELALPDPLPAGTEVCGAAALVDACLAILNSNEFIYVD